MSRIGYAIGMTDHAPYEAPAIEEEDPGPEPRYYHFAVADGVDELNRYSKIGYFFVAVVPGETCATQFLVKKHCTDTTYKNDDDRLFK